MMGNPLGQIVREQISQNVLEGSGKLGRLAIEFKSIPHMRHLVEKIRSVYEGFKPNLPIIYWLRNPCMMKRHWEHLNRQIRLYNSQRGATEEHVDIEIDEELSISLKEVLEGRIHLVKDQLQEASEVASKQRVIERLIGKMKADWKSVRLELAPYGASDSLILANATNILQKLDEDLARTVSLSASQHADFLEYDVLNWRNSLQKVEESMKLWGQLQELWLFF